MPDDTKKTSEAKSTLPAPENDRDRQPEKKPGKGGVPDFDRSATDPDVIKHDGP